MKIHINNTHLFFDVYGSKLNIFPDRIIEKPTLIVLHGGHGMVDHSLYVEFWSQFSDIAQVILIDQRGCGRSDASDASTWNLRQWAQDICAFCQALNIERPIIAGVSMGGHVMCEIINQYPNLPSKLIFCNTEAHFILDDVCAILAERGNESVAKAAYQYFTQPSPATLIPYMNECVPYYAHNAYNSTELSRCIKNLAVFEHYCKHEMLTFDYSTVMTNIICPTLLMVGEDSPLHPPIRAAEMAEKIAPHLVTSHIFKHAGAAVYKDQPEEAYQVVRTFLEKQENTPHE